MIWLLAHILHPLSHEQVVSLSHSSCESPVELTDGRGGGGGVVRGAESYDRKKSRPYINHSIGYALLTALNREIFCTKKCKGRRDRWKWSTGKRWRMNKDE
jgi:hypothetical protein